MTQTDWGPKRCKSGDPKWTPHTYDTPGGWHHPWGEPSPRCPATGDAIVGSARTRRSHGPGLSGRAAPDKLTLIHGYRAHEILWDPFCSPHLFAFPPLHHSKLSNLSKVPSFPLKSPLYSHIFSFSFLTYTPPSSSSKPITYLPHFFPFECKNPSLCLKNLKVQQPLLSLHLVSFKWLPSSSWRRFSPCPPFFLSWGRRGLLRMKLGLAALPVQGGRKAS